MKHLPHLTFLRSFEAAARHLSFTAASEELHCTQSAVSNHVRSLEEFLGRPLFVRLPRTLALTELGEAYLPSVRRALQEIDIATEALLSQRHRREVVVSCPTSLASLWLASVLRAFQREHPEVQVTVHGTVWADVEADVSDISITIHHVDDIPEGALQLWSETLALVCAPGFEVEGAPLTTPTQLGQARRIEVMGRPAYWDLVAQNFGLPGFEMAGGPKTDVSTLAAELAAQGAGCAVLPRVLVRPYLERGALVEPFATEIANPWAYCARFKARTPAPSVRLFRSWLLEAAARVGEGD
ncbi:LysR family transcriptional regulator [Ruegeria pomeroyi]|uniref:Transcriptional regulator, LysR family n=2 Tax=Ruegeria pomeroyi TaxID=89184 RepID=Q5LWZ8_RUEPO|nr:LysR substrate-binding domain-containing protein [Ruegeria pomeroyi]HCE70707.1 LysR family transcriptional regulator [Ruegeria sp.]AAV93532.1 transcriptional regulator, LysR family [Ruegeria pomeroyi DSS-3]NVK96596.1 LysR family transcriptional regulator [Ruegeria pomeroyi]NVL01621.1 LysR family transcriptional regulator [Ruegeria pomeroyi]QWV10822.1 LysR family transcriptional regulator [Ruegeria pomeroyi]